MAEFNINIREITERDVGTVYNLLCALAEYENLLSQVVGTKEELSYSIFTEKSAHCRLIEKDGNAIGYILFFYNYSTFLCKKGLYVEDIFILKEYRGKGYGKAAFEYIISHAKEQNCGRVEWSCLTWNEPSKKFYRALGGTEMEEWRTWRITL